MEVEAEEVGKAYGPLLAAGGALPEVVLGVWRVCRGCSCSAPSVESTVYVCFYVSV